MAQVIIYTTNWCPYCHAAKAFLRAKAVDCEEIDVTDNPDKRFDMEQRSRRHTVPQIFIDGKSVGGYDEIRMLDATGELDRLLGVYGDC